MQGLMLPHLAGMEGKAQAAEMAVLDSRGAVREVMEAKLVLQATAALLVSAPRRARWCCPAGLHATLLALAELVETVAVPVSEVVLRVTW
jgi:hypothetical protein